MTFRNACALLSQLKVGKTWRKTASKNGYSLQRPRTYGQTEERKFRNCDFLKSFLWLHEAAAGVTEKSILRNSTPARRNCADKGIGSQRLTAPCCRRFQVAVSHGKLKTCFYNVRAVLIHTVQATYNATAYSAGSDAVLVSKTPSFRPIELDA